MSFFRKLDEKGFDKPSENNPSMRNVIREMVRGYRKDPIDFVFKMAEGLLYLGFGSLIFFGGIGYFIWTLKDNRPLAVLCTIFGVVSIVIFIYDYTRKRLSWFSIAVLGGWVVCIVIVMIAGNS